MRIALYILSQVALFFSVIIFLRLSYFPAGESPDWAITLGYGSLLITPLIVLRHNRNDFITILYISASWIACRFTGNDLILPIVIYFALATATGLSDRKVVPIIASIAGVYTAILFKVYGQAEHVPAIHQIVLNVFYAAAVLHTGAKVFLGKNHEEETPVSDRYEDYRKAA